MNDSERSQWVMNDEGLYAEYRQSGMSLSKFVRDNRALIDSVMESVSSGRKPAHYLKYGE